MEVDELCGIHSFRNVHQMVSTVSCSVRPDAGFSDILRATFPMGSMTGAPKLRAMEITAETEPVMRGLYSGTLGWAEPNGKGDVGDFHLNVVIRTAVADPASADGAPMLAEPSPHWQRPLPNGRRPGSKHKPFWTSSARLSLWPNPKAKITAMADRFEPLRIALHAALSVRRVPQDQRVWLAVSGGLDSMALMEAASTMQGHFGVLHVDHGLHADSAKIKDFVEAAAARLALPFEHHTLSGLSTSEIAAYPRIGGSSPFSAVCVDGPNSGPRWCCPHRAPRR